MTNYNEIINELKNYKESHPNLTKFWKHYIDLKKETFERSLWECKKSLETFSENNDANLTNLLFIYLFQRSILT